MGYALIFSNSVDQTPNLALASFLKNANIQDPQNLLDLSDQNSGRMNLL